MTKIFFLAFVAIGVSSNATATGKDPWEAQFKPMKGEYLIYGGSLSEQKAPSRDDRKVSLRLVGSVAKDLFDSMYPDEKVKCSTAEGYRERNKDGVSCTYEPDGGYVCYFGFDLRTGKSIGGAIC